MSIVLLGKTDARDFGEEAALQAVVHALRSRSPAGGPTLLSFAPEVHARLGIDVRDAADLGASSAAVAAADLVVVVGNAVWQDAPGWTADGIFAAPRAAPIACVARPLVRAAARGIRVAWLANGIGPLRDPEARQTVAFLAALATQVAVRDEDGADALRTAGYAGSLVVAADPLFTVRPPAATSVPARRRALRIGVVPAATSPDATLRTIADALGILAAGREVDLALVGPAGEDGVAGLRARLAGAPDAVAIAPAEAGAAAAWLATCDVVVTAEVHGAVLAAVAGAPAVCVAATPALLAHAAQLGLADLALPPDACTAEAIARQVERALAAREEIAGQLSARVEVARTVLDAHYDALLAPAPAASDGRLPAVPDAHALAQERITARLRARLEQREESWRTLARLLGRDADAVAPLSTGTAQRSRDIRALRERAEAAEAELATIKRSRGWRALQGWGRFKHRYLLPIGRAVGGRRRLRGRPPHEEEPAPAAVPPGTYDVVCLPIIDWDFRFQRPQHLMSRFAAAGHRVFYVAPRFGPEDGAPLVTARGANLYDVVLAGPARNPWTEALDPKDTEQLFASLNRLRVERALGATLACVQLPFWWPLAALARERLAWPVLYDCMDYHPGFCTSTAATGAHEEALLAAADLVVASSDVLAARARAYRSEVAVVRNGCEYEHFAAAAAPRPAGRRPVIGFYGAIADWFDSDLVADLAERRPDWDFVLVGSVETGDVSRLATLANVRLPGEQPYAELPRWLAGFDVTLLPFKRVPLTEAANPVKAYETLAAGKPIVSVPLPEITRLGGLVYLAETAEEFERAVAAALSPADAAQAAARRAFARGNDWDHRYRDLAARVPALFPRVSTVVVTHENLELTRACLDSVMARTEWPNHEVIVVDNGSTDGTRAYLEARARARSDAIVIANDDNRGFAAACNQGLARASGEYLALLNNDTVVTRGWVSTLVRHLHAVPEIGLIGPTTNEIGNEAKVAVGYADRAAMPAWAARFTRAHADELLAMPMLAMFCVAMRRDAFTEIGPLDERFTIGFFEDDDYARRMQANGYRVVCARDAFVHHVGGAAFKRLDRTRFDAIFARNQRAFERKWGPWTPHEDPTTPARRSRLRGELDRILAAADVAPRDVVVFVRFLAEPTAATARAERLAAALAARGMLVFVHGPPDEADGFRPLADYLWSYCGPSGTLERLAHPVVWTLPYNAREACRWLTGTTVYDLGVPLASLPCDPATVRANHERMLRDADVVVCGSRALQHEVRAERPDAVYLPDVDAPDEPDAASVRLAGFVATLRAGPAGGRPRPPAAARAPAAGRPDAARAPR